ncbi:Phosphopantetheine attachment site [Posidoniimonas polymericola]|uniref:Phosphopantetheine attachment site n=1 Tax=Posidoniimonas polymericola TaxID=2528002 RepID=A0A5C5YS70_9BACT|nr:acyl carrier protein [Posidoniimonas polymericola]TWT77779.1 Phosphopantetheine attachment site [Posidoniimonas polymericola]
MTQLYAHLEELFEVDPGTITGQEKLTELPGWSSLMFVSVIAMIDEEYEVSLEPKLIIGCENIKALRLALEETLSRQRAA